MVTKEQAIQGREFHYGECKKIVGSRGGVTYKIETWRASGACKTWKTRPTEFRLPIMYGLYSHSYLTHQNAKEFHLASECPLNRRFKVIEYSSFFAVQDTKTGQEHPMSDGVDAVFDENDQALSPGSEGFTEQWELALNANPDETLEAYFPEQYDKEREG